MGNITFIEHDGTSHSVEIESGQTLMQAAIDNNVPGIDADCGGECACGTCHVIIQGPGVTLSGSPSDDEIQMLDLNPERDEASRLACQVVVSDGMDGMVARLPEFQM